MQNNKIRHVTVQADPPKLSLLLPPTPKKEKKNSFWLDTWCLVSTMAPGNCCSPGPNLGHLLILPLHPACNLAGRCRSSALQIRSKPEKLNFLWKICCFGRPQPSDKKDFTVWEQELTGFGKHCFFNPLGSGEFLGSLRAKKDFYGTRVVIFLGVWGGCFLNFWATDTLNGQLVEPSNSPI